MMDIPMIISEVISDIMMLIAAVVLVDIVEVDHPKIRPLFLSIAIIAISILSIFSYIVAKSDNLLMWIIIFFPHCFKNCIAIMIIYRRYSIKVIWIVLIVQLICELIDSGILTVVTRGVNDMINFTSLLSRIIILIALIIIKKRNKKTYEKGIFKLIPNHIFFLIAVSCFLASGLIYVADFEISNYNTKIQLIKVLSLAIVLCLISVFISLLTNVMAKKYYSDLNRILEQQVQAQISHYEQREKANTELRKFKHDYNNHINCIQALISSGRYEEVSEYLNKLSTLLPSDSFLYKTGNYLSDAILTDKQEKAKKDKIQISFSGTIPTSINNTDLCIILSNALDNAIESSRMCEGEKEISVYGGYRHGYFILVMKNPTVNNISDNAALPATTKEDKLHHGFGLLNINTVVEKYNGFMKIECKDNQFVLSLTFNSVTSIAD